MEAAVVADQATKLGVIPQISNDMLTPVGSTSMDSTVIKISEDKNCACTEHVQTLFSSLLPDKHTVWTYAVFPRYWLL
jgi:hypothetical protein